MGQKLVEEYFKPPKGVDGRILLRSQWSVDIKRKYILNCKAIIQILFTLDPTKFNSMPSCKMAKEI